MKYYDFDIDSKISYILKYKIKGNSIKVYYANGEKERIPYTIDNEKNIIKQMKSQVSDINFDEYKEYTNDLIKLNWIRSLIIFIAGISLGALFGVNIEGYLALSIGLVILTVIPSSINTVKLKSLYKDFGKNKTYVENTDILKEALMLGVTKNELLENTSNKTKNEIKKNDNKLNINAIDKIPYKDVVGILGNAHREIELKRERVK